MRKIVVIQNITLDGVMQSPGRADEDQHRGFEHGGWAVPYGDEVMGQEMGKGMGTTELLFGRRTYEDFYSVWPNQPEPNPFTEVLNNTPKYVVSTTLSEPLPWVNSTLLGGDVLEAVSRLKESPGPDLGVLGSGELVRSLMGHDLIDAYVLLIHPLILGTGQKLFPDRASQAGLELVDSVNSTTGVMIATYRRS